MFLFWECEYFEPINEKGKPGRCVSDTGSGTMGSIATKGPLSFCNCKLECQNNKACTFFSYRWYDANEFYPNCWLYEDLSEIEDASENMNKIDGVWGNTGCYSLYGESYFFNIYTIS